ncbi:beta-lactamase fold Zn-dependent hydrolase [Sorangium cellulosum]|uniref:Beta-lactamase fold Zn-dependent hydrolase n=1 Tax=Sorangium cellulosum TaxID=56 RepID=A0A4P2Q0X2_SORCE|nr:MBL fold metallo-hydrolase [Sorangium cellulosum]AUX22877.1 beta-lactamase fold Zn-dependent hydrolase [Sorangium cellulosum]
MFFEVLSHAALHIRSSGVSLITDPWLVGSTDWRSWWNYPPPRRDVVDALRPDFIYLTHIHWDHFQGPSLRKLGKGTPVIIPRGPHDRMKRDLLAMGFKDIIELDHGETFRIHRDFAATSYHFGPFLDSALVVEAEGVTLFNANDAKLMGAPLQQVLARHPRIDFVFRSHSSANGRLCYEVVDAAGAPVDDIEGYIAGFAKFVRRTGARYAVPFASNHCFLHRDVFALNTTIQTPRMVEDHFRKHGITSPALKVMLSGDSWSTDAGFSISAEAARYFDDRTAMLERCRDENRDKLEKFYALEARTRLSRDDLDKYFSAFAAVIPAVLRRLFRGRPITYALDGAERYVFEVDLDRGAVEQRREPRETAEGPLEIHTSAFILRQCMALDLFCHLPISKRVRYRVSKRTRRYIQVLNYLFNLVEYGWLPLDRSLRLSTARQLAPRWREGLLMAQLLRDVALGRGLSVARYL